ncbi:MAG: ABC transporter ATP-binding protein [Xanthobacteraceae bacterium]|nr:MAG: ABC transporter ATP-binding protein [Xanthobacteraceae bacterium]
MIEARGLSIGYGRRMVASAIDFAVGIGEVLCILGPNGSGKTTLFKTLLGLLPPLAGDVRLNGAEIASHTRREIAHRISYVPQAHAPVFSYSVFDLVLMGRTAHLGPFSNPSARDNEKALAALQSLGIAALADADATRISGGQLQLALIARALAQEAHIIVMDEPTASLDFGNKLIVLDHIRRLAARGFSIILSTHEPEHAFDLADRVALIARGELAAIGSPDATLTGERLSQVYGVPLRIECTCSSYRVVRPK